ncbi:MAG: hypothetical protein PHY93_02695 [Bacteriovorax sp.]|nr:hypothetical protein [Bacteriovorax sp.]
MNSIIKNHFFILFCFFILTINAYAVDESVFAERYPNFQDYQSLSLQGLNNYFYSLFSKSITLHGQKDFYQLVVLDDLGQTITKIDARIERSRTEATLTESMHFILPNDEHFDYTLTRAGINLVETADMDLLTFNFNTKEESYDLAFKQLEARFQKQKNNKGVEKSFILLGIMEINILIETNLQEFEGNRNYIYFFKGMPNPQTILTVRVLSENHNLNFIHSSKGVKISPKYFFQGLDEGSQIFTGFSQISLKTLETIGFPKIKGIN